MLDAKEHNEVEMGSERGFGLVFAAVFAIIGLYPLWGGGPIRWWAMAIAAVFVLLAFFAPKVMAPLNKLWFKFGILLGKIVAPIIMGLVFFLTVVPTGFVMRMLGKDLLRQKIDKDAESYWINRDEPAGSMKNQF